MKTMHLILPLLGVLLCSGCGTIMGKSISTKTSGSFNIKNYKRYNTNLDNNSYFILDDIEPPFEAEGLIYNNTMNKKGDIEIYVISELGYCLPPRYNPRIRGYWYTFPRKVSVKLEDAITKKVLLEIHYKRALFATGTGYEECGNIIIEALKKAFAESKKNPTNPSKQ